MSEIKVSILIATYNRIVELKKCIESVLNTDFPKDEFEILIGDGGSTDSTSEYLSDLIKKSKKNPNQYPNIRYFRELKNLGGMGNRIKPLTVSRGKYICTLDSDAIVPKNWLKIIYNFMETQNLDVSGGFQLTNPNRAPVIGHDLGSNGLAVAAYKVKNPLYISGVATFFRRSMLITMGGFDPVMIYGGADMELGIRARIFTRKILGTIKTTIDHTTKPKREHHRAKKNLENLIYFQFSRHIYLFLKNFEWRYGIILSLRITLFETFQFAKALFNKRIDIIKGYIKGIRWILFNLGIIIMNHNRIKRNIKSSEIIKKYFHPYPNIFSKFLRKI